MKKQKSLRFHLPKRLKTIVCFVAVVVFLSALAPSALALETGIEYGTATGLGTQDIRITVMRIIQVVLGFVGIVFLAFVLYGGYLWMTSAGNAERVDQAKRTLRNAIIGLVIILSAFSIVSFIISQLLEATGLGRDGTGIPPGSGCINCGHLGSGIIERVYPEPFARDVARNTNIMVSFKVAMDPATIIKGCSALPCSGELESDNVAIFPDARGSSAALADSEVVASTNDAKTFVFNPVDFLGNPTNDVWYAVRLGDGIRKDNQESAFPGAGNFFIWRFEVGTFLDIDPPIISNVFPVPDSQADSYSTTAALPASGALEVREQPRVAVTASVSEPVIIAGSTAASVSGSYTDSFSGRITVTINSSSPNTATVFWQNGDPNNNTSASISGGTINIGGGLQLTLEPGYQPGNQWGIDVVAEQNPDTLLVNTRTYSFVSTNPGSNQIAVGATLGQTATNIAAKVDADNIGVDVASVSGATVFFEATVAGSSGNNISLLSSGSWARITPFSDGANVSFTPTVAGAPDKPRNAAFIIDFNESVDPLQLTADHVIVQYETPVGSDNWTTLEASYLVSNQYKTLEMLSNQECVDASGQPVVNSCGERIFCWPVNEPDPFEPTRYRVIVKAGLLNECASDADCTDPNYTSCVATPGGSGAACQGTFDVGGSVYYPTARAVPQGIIDAASNSLNGNKNTYGLDGRLHGQAEGPGYFNDPNEPNNQSNQQAFSLNDQAVDTGDDLVWYFYLNTDIDLSPPVLSAISPDIATVGVSMSAPVAGTFSEVILASTLKPGSNYRDGSCYCDATNNTCPAGQTCDTTVNRCKGDGSSSPSCFEDQECPANHPEFGSLCLNKKYVKLIDQSVSPVGWWITKQNLDTIVPLDGFADQSVGIINHTTFFAVTAYGAEYGSGIKDAFQNCYLPGAGPGLPGSAGCSVTAGKPYCCNGLAMSAGEWQVSACFTGF